MAWSDTDVRDSLPGPAVYWGCTAVVLITVVALISVGVRLWRAQQDRGRVRLGVETRARFATTRDLAPLLVRPAGSVGTLRARTGSRQARRDRGSPAGRGHGALGGRAGFRQGDRGSVAVIGPSRSGKTVNVISGLLDWNGPAVVVSVKRDLIDATRAARSAIGETRVFDPSGVSGLPPEGLARWTPLRAASTPRARRKRPRRSPHRSHGRVSTGEPTTGSSRPRSSSPDCSAPRRSTGTARWSTSRVGVQQVDPRQGSAKRDHRPPQVAKDYGYPSEREAAGAAMLQLDAIWNLDERVRSSVYATVQTVVQAWLDPAVEASAILDKTQPAFVDLAWLSDPARANTLYLVAPLDDQKRLAPVLGGLLGDLKDQAYQADIAGTGLSRPLLMVVDEAGNMPLAWLPEVAATCAGIGILLVTIWQSKAQLDAAYGRLADSVLTNHLTKVVFSGCSDSATLDYVSRLLGDEEVQHRSMSYDLGGGHRRSVSESTHREALTPFHLLRQVRPGEAVLIHGTLPPAHLQARRYWTEPRFERALPPCRTARVTSRRRRQ